MLFFDSRKQIGFSGSRRIHPRERVAQEVELAPGTLQIRVLSSLTVSFRLPMRI
jgi:hypothetical protein